MLVKGLQLHPEQKRKLLKGFKHKSSPLFVFVFGKKIAIPSSMLTFQILKNDTIKQKFLLN